MSDKMTENTRIIRGDLDYGRRGERTGVFAYKNGYNEKEHEIRVGDVVCYTVDGLSFSGVVLKKLGRYGIMGRGIYNLSYANLTISVPYEDVPIEMINAIHRVDDFEYVAEEAVEMTLEEIEEIVGNNVKIIKGRR